MLGLIKPLCNKSFNCQFNFLSSAGAIRKRGIEMSWVSRRKSITKLNYVLGRITRRSSRSTSKSSFTSGRLKSRGFQISILNPHQMIDALLKNYFLSFRHDMNQPLNTKSLPSTIRLTHLEIKILQFRFYHQWRYNNHKVNPCKNNIKSVIASFMSSFSARQKWRNFYRLSWLNLNQQQRYKQKKN